MLCPVPTFAAQPGLSLPSDPCFAQWAGIYDANPKGTEAFDWSSHYLAQPLGGLLSPVSFLCAASAFTSSPSFTLSHFFNRTCNFPISLLLQLGCLPSHAPSFHHHHHHHLTQRSNRQCHTFRINQAFCFPSFKMPSNAFNDFSGSPTLLLSPQHHHHPFCAASSAAHTFHYYQSFQVIMPSRASSRSSNKSSPESNAPGQTPPTQPNTVPTTPALPIPNANRSRKRNRDEVEDEDVAMDIGPSTGRSPDPVHGRHIPARDPMTGKETNTEGQTNLSGM